MPGATLWIDLPFEPTWERTATPPRPYIRARLQPTEDVMQTFLPELDPPAKEVVAVVCGADYAAETVRCYRFGCA